MDLNLGDVDPLEYGGFFVWKDGTVRVLEAPEGDIEHWEVYELNLQDVRDCMDEADLASVASACDHENVAEDLASDDFTRWPHAMRSVQLCWGAYHLGADVYQLTEEEAIEECHGLPD